MTATTPARPHTKWGFAALFGLAAAIVVGIVVLAFVWPAATAKVRDLPVAISGPAAEITAVKDAVAKTDPDPISFQTVTDRAAAVARIKDRAVLGAIVLGERPEVLVTGAGSSAAAGLLRGFAPQLQAKLAAAVVAQGGDASTVHVAVTDVVPLDSSDPTGAGLSAAAFPLVLGGIIGGVLLSLLVVGVVRRLVGLVVYGVATGVIVTLILHTWFDVLPGDFVPLAGAIGLAIAATAAVIVGFNALIGSIGIPVGAVITMLIGNPISAAALPYQFLPDPWGIIGQYFVPGATANLIRSIAYFPDAATGAQWLTLALWTAGGMLLAVVGHFRGAAPIPLPAAELEAA